MKIAQFFLFLLLLEGVVAAHQTGLSYITIVQKSIKDIRINYKKPLSDTRGEDITIRYPKNCSKAVQTSHTIENGFILKNFKLSCSENGLLKRRVWVDGLLSKDRGVLISFKNDDFNTTALLRATTPFILISKQSSRWEFFKEYVLLGVEHIWSGYDHLLFVLSLILLSSSMKRLLWSITGFTLAHSITLAFGILGIVTVGVGYIEAMIALSILFLARELLMEEETLTKRYLGGVAFIFGLLHGFGFSSVLRTIGLPQEEIPLSLFAFNLGIEIGQLLFIFVVVSLLGVVKRYIEPYMLKVKLLLAYFIGTLSMYWFIDRFLAF